MDKNTKMDLRTYCRYFIYILEHKWYVFLECSKRGMIIHGIFHDLSKFLPSEFFPYAIKFLGGDYAYKYFEVEKAFESAWLLHQHRNKHHWDYWVKSDGLPIPMPKKNIMQMISDWSAMSRKFGGSPQKYFRENNHKMNLHPWTVNILKEEGYVI